jgi:two-component system, chemotaxis family, protein-glutamate methylesterase/glutaminase
VILQHIAEGTEPRFAHWLSTLGRPAVVARHRTPLSSTHAVIPPSARHLLLAPPDLVELSDAPAWEGHKPSAVLLLRSAVFLGARLVTVVLSGLGRDGSAALPALVASGATCLVQRPDECVAPSMPEAALETAPSARSLGLVDLVLALRAATGHAR